MNDVMCVIDKIIF